MAQVTSKRVIWSVVIIGLLLLGAASVFALNLPGFGKYQKARVENGTVSIPVAKLADGKAQFYRLEEGGKTIAFFAVKAADGSIKTAFDACDACYKAKKGYEQQGEKMNCKNCNQKFAISKLGPNATGGCNPGYLPNQVSGGNVIIKVDDLRGGAHYF